MDDSGNPNPEHLYYHEARAPELQLSRWGWTALLDSDGFTTWQDPETGRAYSEAAATQIALERALVAPSE